MSKGAASVAGEGVFVFDEELVEEDLVQAPANRRRSAEICGLTVLGQVQGTAKVRRRL